MIPVIRWTIWQRRLSTIWWSIGVFGFIFINMIFYPTFKDQAAELQKSFESLSDTALQFFGGSSDFFSPVGFLNSQIFFLMLPLLLGILAIGLGSSLIAREEQDQTLETLLARPISRSRLLLAKSLAGIIILTIVTLAGLLTTVIIAKIVDITVPVSYMIYATAACYLLVLSFGAIALLITTLGRARGASLGLTALIALGGYIISSLSGTVNWLKGVSRIFPFHYYHSEDILRGHFIWSDILVLAIVVLACGLLGWLSFRRRDIG